MFHVEHANFAMMLSVGIVSRETVPRRRERVVLVPRGTILTKPTWLRLRVFHMEHFCYAQPFPSVFHVKHLASSSRLC